MYGGLSLKSPWVSGGCMIQAERPECPGGFLCSQMGLGGASAKSPTETQRRSYGCLVAFCPTERWRAAGAVDVTDAGSMSRATGVARSPDIGCHRMPLDPRFPHENSNYV